ncbi:MAG: hypothetical protein JSW56_13735 [Deltaproteobacteria bacterium]|nr:MAG: hypothetical protein JSW56_13735 [Deltaproteobacteria bacterium]
MNQGTMGCMVIRYINGNEQRFEFERQEEALNIASQIKDLLSANQLMLELEDRLLVIPFQNVEYIEVAPSPEKLPSNAIRNVRLIPIKSK